MLEDQMKHYVGLDLVILAEQLMELEQGQGMELEQADYKSRRRLV